jgi:hypothetical protein
MPDSILDPPQQCSSAYSWSGFLYAISFSMITSDNVPFFGHGNAKLPESTLTFALPSGFTCPGALHCLARADRVTGKITDGPSQRFRCHEASIEALRTNVRQKRWRNLEIISGLNPDQMATLLMAGLSSARNFKTTHIRWFTGGDCFSADLRDAIIKCSQETPELIHYLYTKNLYLWLEDSDAPSGPRPLPANLRVTASWGGKFDHLLEAGLFPRTSRVVNTCREALSLKLPIDFSDRLAWQREPGHFCHLAHGAQPAGSLAGAAIRERRRLGEFSGYGRGSYAA